MELQGTQIFQSPGLARRTTMDATHVSLNAVIMGDPNSILVPSRMTFFSDRHGLFVTEIACGGTHTIFLTRPNSDKAAVKAKLGRPRSLFDQRGRLRESQSDSQPSSTARRGEDTANNLDMSRDSIEIDPRATMPLS